MHLAMVAKITFKASRNRAAIVLRKPTAVTVEKSWKTLTDMATITMPRNVLDFDKQKVKELFKPDDPVVIELGYNGQYITEFTGYISKVSADVPIKIELEDEMRIIRKIPVNASFARTSLKDLFKTLLPSYTVDALEVQLGAVRFAKTNMGQVLTYLKDEYSLYSYMKDGVLVCGKIYADDTTEDLKKYKVDGFTGNVATFGIPFIDHGYKVELTSAVYPDRNGTYYVERTKVNFDDTPQYRRTVELGDKVA